MRRKLQRRIISLLAIVAFGATGAADAYGLHSCPHHDALPAGPSHGASAVAAHSDGAGHAAASERGDAGTSLAEDAGSAQHAAPGDGPAPGTQAADAASHDGHGPCNCVGTCSANPPATPLASSHVTIVAPLSAAAPIVPEHVRPHARTTPYLLPWANAPPFSASV